ncbi:hypothetical protein [Salinisphaera sp. Q1T1-3]|uniref:hypothetical protein n=1 Tax=Salinisphaera sp. Q1T1-3 TaxID=2321229 RepID=UPI001313E2E9|nr:hypothetical protein [Salinisphaera sp. Q1T1-3]
MSHASSPGAAHIDRFIDDFERTLHRLEQAPAFSKFTHVMQLLGHAARLLKSEAGITALYRHAERLGPAGVFDGSDWADPAGLVPGLVGPTLRAGGDTAVLECLSELRMLAIADGRDAAAVLTAEEARAFLRQVLAANLDLAFPVATEQERERAAIDAERIRVLFDFLLARLGAGAIIGDLLDEVSRVMTERPVRAQRADALLRAADQALAAGIADVAIQGIARHWLAALKGPSALAQAHAEADYAAALADCDHDQLTAEAGVFGAAMNETGLVSPAHAQLIHHLTATAPALLPLALGLDEVGRASLAAHGERLTPIIIAAITPATARAIYGLSRLLNAGLLFDRPILAGLQRLMRITLHPESVAVLGQGNPPSVDAADVAPTTRLLAGTLSVLGQPRGIDQGHNPTCQSARAISLWAQNDPGYLLDLIARAARDNDLVMDFEGQSLRASDLAAGMARELHPELDPISRLLTPHIDRIYVEMGRRTVGRVGDGHRWVNRELHGWWVLPDFAELIELPAGGLITDCETFIRRFHAAYHPAYNGGRELVYAQPCGIASTTHTGQWVGWHAVAIQRVARGPDGDWRVYFFNPNQDKAQNWGQDILTSTHDADEFEGESSLPFAQFAARIYVFHYRAEEIGTLAEVPDRDVTAVRRLIAAGWGQRFGLTD